MPHCVYVVITDSRTFDLNVGDTICVDCPADNECRGSTSTDKNLDIQDATGKKGKVVLRLQSPGCTTCPPQVGKTGYSFAPVTGVIY
jgi:hypothetical protein